MCGFVDYIKEQTMAFLRGQNYWSDTSNGNGNEQNCPGGQKYAVIFGATSLLAQCIAHELWIGSYNLILIARNSAQLTRLVDALQPRGSQAVLAHCSSLNSAESIDSALNWLRGLPVDPELAMVCPGVIFDDNSMAPLSEILEAVFVNTLLPLYVSEYFAQSETTKIVTISSLFAKACKKGKMVYSLSKRLAYVLINERMEISKKKHYMFLLGPMYTPMYTGPKRFYVAEPQTIAKAICRMVHARDGGILTLPNSWSYLMPLLILANCIF